MTYRLTASYHHTEDDERLVAYYRDNHAALGAALPDLRAFTWGVSETPDGSRPPHALVAVLDWDSKEACLAALESQAGRDAVADQANFAHGGVDMEFQEVMETV